MIQTYEISKFDSHTPFRCMIHHIGFVKKHSHEFFEIIFVLSGSCSILIDDTLYPLSDGDLIIVDDQVPHELRASDCVYASVQLDRNALENNFPVPSHPSFECNSKMPGKEEALDQMRGLIARLIKNNSDRQSGYELRNWVLVYQLMDVLYTHFRVERTAAVERRNHRYASRIAELSRLIREHYKEDLPLSRVADMVHLSAPYLSKFFNEQFGMNYLAYLTQLRISSAVSELINTEKNIEEISQDNGFPNSHAFTQAFQKEYHMMPSAYRRLQKQEQAEGSIVPLEYHDYLSGLEKYLKSTPSVTPRLPALSAGGECSASAAGKPLRHSWKKVVSIGKASDLLISDVQELLRRVKKELGCQYVFFNGIFSDDLYVYSTKNGQVFYSFAYVDRILDFLDGIGLFPFLSFSYMPSELAKNPDRLLFNHLVSEPKSISDWCHLIRAFLEHVFHRYGADRVLQWKFSVWHLPNTSPKLYGFEKDQDFYEFYRASRQTVKDFHPNLCFGFPSIYGNTTEDYADWHLEMLKWCRQNECMPDFINFTYYDIHITKQRTNTKSAFGFVFMMVLNEEPDGVHRFISSVKKDLRSLGMENLPVYISEWNSSPSQQDLLNDTCFKSCYIAKNIIDNYDRTESLSYWSLTDLMSEAPIPDSLLSGGLGLFTACGMPKASYYAMALLAQLGGELLAKGDGWIITRTRQDIRIVSCHYIHYSHLYAMGEQFAMTPRNRYAMFESIQSLDLTLHITDMKNRSYKIKQYVVGRQSGSLYDTWSRAGGTDPDTKNDREILEALSVPALRQSEAEASDGRLSLTIHMEPLDVVLTIIES